METNDERILDAVRHTEILRAPKQSLYTFGITNIYYYLVTEPVYSELLNNISETVIREGRVIAERPRIVTPYYLSSLEGFSPGDIFGLYWKNSAQIVVACITLTGMSPKS